MPLASSYVEKDQAPAPVQMFGETGAAAHFRLVDPAGSGFFDPLDQRVARDGRSVASASAW